MAHAYPKIIGGELLAVNVEFNSLHEVHVSFSDDLAYDVSSLRRRKRPM